MSALSPNRSLATVLASLFLVAGSGHVSGSDSPHLGVTVTIIDDGTVKGGPMGPVQYKHTGADCDQWEELSRKSVSEIVPHKTVDKWWFKCIKISTLDVPQEAVGLDVLRGRWQNGAPAILIIRKDFFERIEFCRLSQSYGDEFFEKQSIRVGEDFVKHYGERGFRIVHGWRSCHKTEGVP